MTDIEKRITLITCDFMKLHDLSQNELAKSIGVSQPSLSRALTGGRAWLVRDVQALANVGVDFTHLFDDGEV